MRCLLLKVFIVILTTAAVCISQNNSEPEALRFNEGAVELFNAEKYLSAVEALDQALALEPNNFIFHYNLGMAYYKAGDFAKAATSFRRVTELRPDYAVGHNQLGVVLMETHQDERALEAFSTAIRLAPTDPAVEFNLGCTYIRLGRYKDAAKLLESARTAAARAGDYPEVHLNLGYAYAMRKQFKKAIPEIERAVAMDPAAVEPQYFLGILYLSAGQRDEALRQQKIVESLDHEIGRKLYNEIFKDKLLIVSEQKPPGG